MVKGPLVVVVDDDKSIRHATQDLLKSAGFSAVTFEDAESFLASASRASAACLVTDMRMPGMTGLELHHELVVSGDFIPTIIITAHPEEQTRVRARAAGISCYLTKPVTPDELLECVREALAKPRTRAPIPKS
jgi:FixJ family two-component response regulator